jgi:hypothetical protein|tara:strand:+ start:38 stop:271 length:234 start_codon:yes stop_codon:yes gene_type:complete
MAEKNDHMIGNAQIQIVGRDGGLIAIASFHWDPSICWMEFIKRVAGIADRMYMEFDSDGVTQHIHFKTGGGVRAIDQ